MFPKDPEDEIIGKLVRVKSCEANEHGDNSGCICHLIGEIVRVGRRRKSQYAGTPSYYLRWRTQTVRRSEVVLLKNQWVFVRALKLLFGKTSPSI